MTLYGYCFAGQGLQDITCEQASIAQQTDHLKAKKEIKTAQEQGKACVKHFNNQRLVRVLCNFCHDKGLFNYSRQCIKPEKLVQLAWAKKKQQKTIPVSVNGAPR